MHLNKLQQVRSHIVAWFVLQNSSGGVQIVTETVATNVFMDKNVHLGLFSLKSSDVTGPPIASEVKVLTTNPPRASCFHIAVVSPRFLLSLLRINYKIHLRGHTAACLIFVRPRRSFTSGGLKLKSTWTRSR